MWFPWLRSEVVTLDDFETEEQRKERERREEEERLRDAELRENTQPRYLPWLFRQN